MNTLRVRLIATFLIVAVAAVGIVGLLSVTRARQAIIETAWKEGDALVSALSLELNAYLRERSKMVQMQADRHIIRAMNWAEQEPSLVPLLEEYAFMDAFVADLDGDISFVKNGADGTNIKDRPYFQQVLKEKKSIISESLAHRVTKELTFFYASPITNNGTIVGVLVAAENMAHIGKVVASIAWGRKG